MANQQEKNKARIIKANYRLQHKVGSGPLDEKTVRASQQVIDTNTVEFEPLGLAILERLEAALVRSADSNAAVAQIKPQLTAPVMELKANAATFGYPLIGNLATIMLSFLESILRMDDDAVEIVRAHHKTLHMIIIRRIKGDGGAAGAQLIQELRQACERYYARKSAR